MNFKMPVVLTILMMVVIFTLQNTEVVDISFFFWHFSMSRALMLFIVLAIGLLLGWILGSVKRHEKDAETLQARPPEKRDDGFHME